MKQYGIKTPNSEFVQKAADIYEASLRCGLDDVIYVRERDDWYRPHCEYCQEQGDLRELFGHLGCPHCWAEIAEASQDEIRWQKRHADDHKQAA